MNHVKQSKVIKRLLSTAATAGAFQHIAKDILLNINQIESLSIIHLANHAYVAPSTISKFVKRLGYSSFSSFKKDLKLYREHSKVNKPKTIIKQKSLLSDLNLFISNFAKFDLSLLASYLRQADKIIVNAVGGALRVSNEFIVALERMNYHVLAPEDFVTRYTVALKANEQSVVICITNNVETLETTIPTEIAHQNGAKIIFITKKQVKSIANWSNSYYVLINDYLPKRISSELFSLITPIILTNILVLI